MPRFAPILRAAFILWMLAGPSLRAEEWSGFLEPFRTVEVAAPETGTVLEMNVQEGDKLSQGDTIARLDRSVLLVALALAEQSTEMRGALRAAQAEAELRRLHLTNLEELAAQGHARPHEVERARADLAMAEARVLSAEEELILRRLELDRIKAQIDRRDIVAPISGVVSQVLKEPGEFVAANSPALIKMVQLDHLLAVFAIPEATAVSLAIGKEIEVKVLPSGKSVAGVVYSIRPVTDAESGTVRVKVKLANPKGTFRSGSRCLLQISHPPTS